MHNENKNPQPQDESLTVLGDDMLALVAGGRCGGGKKKKRK
jgi:hypothetical protein